MNDSLYVAATGLQAQQLGIDTIANNLANISTVGFKKGRANFQQILYAESAIGTGGAINSAANALGLGVGVGGISRDFSPGAPIQTNSPLDLAIDGNGFLEVTLADGSHGYIRGGSLQITKDSYLASSSGQILKPTIHLPSNFSSLVISEDGKVTVQTPNHAQPIQIGQLELVSFANPSALSANSGGVYMPNEKSGEPVYGKPGTLGMGKIMQHTLEGSNTSIVNEMVALMETQRAYELSSKVLQTSDELMSMTNNLRR